MRFVLCHSSQKHFVGDSKHTNKVVGIYIPTTIRDVHYNVTDYRLLPVI